MSIRGFDFFAIKKDFFRAKLIFGWWVFISPEFLQSKRILWSGIESSLLWLFSGHFLTLKQYIFRIFKFPKPSHFSLFSHIWNTTYPVLSNLAIKNTRFCNPLFHFGLYSRCEIKLELAIKPKKDSRVLFFWARAERGFVGQFLSVSWYYWICFSRIFRAFCRGCIRGLIGVEFLRGRFWKFWGFCLENANFWSFFLDSMIDYCGLPRFC
jgi:hypothetical protein